jgi:putative flippase GtrA
MLPFKLPAFVERFLNSELFRYLVSGTIAFLCDLTVFLVGTELLAIHYLISNIGGYAVGLLVSYFINIKWVFKHRRYDDQQAHEFVYFTIIVLIGLTISEGVLFVAAESFDIPMIWAKIISTFFVFLFNYIAKKWLLFSPEKPTS